MLNCGWLSNLDLDSKLWQFCDKISQCSIVSKVHRATLSEQISPVRKKNTLQIPQTWQDQLLYSQILNLEHLMINGYTHGPTSWFFCRRYYHIALPYLFDIWVVKSRKIMYLGILRIGCTCPLEHFIFQSHHLRIFSWNTLIWRIHWN